VPRIEEMFAFVAEDSGPQTGKNIKLLHFTQREDLGDV